MKYIINNLNKSGPLATVFEEYWYEKQKLKTSSVISFGLKPLVKFEGNDSLFKIWHSSSKPKLLKKSDHSALEEYRSYCTNQVRNIFIGLKDNIKKENWVVSRTNPHAILSVTMVNGIINCLRLLIENNKQGDVEYYKRKFKKIASFDFKKFKSSQYRKMGQEIYNICFK